MDTRRRGWKPLDRCRLEGSLRRWRGLLLVGLLLPVAGNGKPATAPAHLPFSAGEELTYRVRLGVLGTVGSGTMRVEGPVLLRGTSTLVIRSEMRSTVGGVNGLDRTSSWFDPARLRSLRFEKQEQTPLGRRDETVEIFGPERRWQGIDGSGGTSPTDSPLDELSFIYFIRTLPLAVGQTHTFERHFDHKRNPVRLRILRREPISVGAGDFDAVVVEMRVRDPGRFRGENRIIIHLSDDGRRLPLRIESPVPRLGTTVLTLESHSRSGD
jgi:hypothetical protein